MIANVGSTDKLIRISIAVLIAALYFTHMISGTLAIVLGIVAIIMALTALISFCPLYAIFGFNSCPVKK
jgi:MFS-type transporter involved in bile tolerance (Atg22 family)